MTRTVGPRPRQFFRHRVILAPSFCTVHQNAGQGITFNRHSNIHTRTLAYTHAHTCIHARTHKHTHTHTSSIAITPNVPANCRCTSNCQVGDVLIALNEAMQNEKASEHWIFHVFPRDFRRRSLMPQHQYFQYLRQEANALTCPAPHLVLTKYFATRHPAVTLNQTVHH